MSGTGTGASIDLLFDPRELRAVETMIAAWPLRFVPSNRSSSTDVDAVDRHLRAVWAQRVAARLGDGADLLGTALAAIRLVRGLVVSPRQVWGVRVDDDIADPRLHSSLFARLVGGLTNCESMAALVADIIEAAGHAIYFVETGVYDGGTHTVLVGVAGGRWCVFDPWADFHVWWTPELDLDRAGREWASPDAAPAPHTPMEGLPSLAELIAEAPDFRALGLYPPDVFLDARIKDPRWLRRLANRDHVADEAAFTSLAGTRAVDAPPDTPWGRYLRVRTAHVAGMLHDPPATYRTLLREHRYGGATRTLIEVLAEAAESGMRHRPSRPRPQ